MRWLQHSKQSWAAMMDLRAVLSRSDGEQDLSRMRDDRVIDELVSMVASGRLHLCEAAGPLDFTDASWTEAAGAVVPQGTNPMRSDQDTAPKQPTPQRAKPFPQEGTTVGTGKTGSSSNTTAARGAKTGTTNKTTGTGTGTTASPTLQVPEMNVPGIQVPGAPGTGTAQTPPEHTVVFSGAKEEPAKPDPVKKPAPSSAKPKEEVLHWFEVQLKPAPELKARPAWWPPAANSPVGYGANTIIVTLGGVSPPEQKLDFDGKFHVDLIPPGSAKIHFREYFAALESTFISGTSV